MSSYFIVRHSDLPRSLPASASRPAIPTITVLLAMGRCISRWARRHYVGLWRTPDRAVEGLQRALRQCPSVGVRRGGDLLDQPLAACLQSATVCHDGGA